MPTSLEPLVTQSQLTTASVEMAAKGQVTIPKPLRDKYGLVGGSRLGFVDLGGMLIISPLDNADGIRRIDANFDEMREELVASGASLESMLAKLRRIRESEPPSTVTEAHSDD
ncbi:MAG: AbrB/MazE/SpoVT family DNA-binding domain-containing protein [Capsulimonadaceae bacterium]